jgi:hypothetical protein
MAAGFGIHESVPVLARVKPQTITAAATVDSDAVDMSNFPEVLVIFNMGDYAAGNDGSVEVKITGDTASGGSYATDITGKALTTGTFTGSTGDDAVGIIRVTREEVAAQGLRYIRAEVTPSDQNLTCGLVIVGSYARYNPATNFDLSDVAEIIE